MIRKVKKTNKPIEEEDSNHDEINKKIKKKMIKIQKSFEQSPPRKGPTVKKFNPSRILEHYYPETATLTFPLELEMCIIKVIQSFKNKCKSKDLEENIKRFYIDPMPENWSLIFYKNLAQLEEDGLVYYNQEQYSTLNKAQSSQVIEIDEKDQDLQLDVAFETMNLSQKKNIECEAASSPTHQEVII